MTLTTETTGFPIYGMHDLCPLDTLLPGGTLVIPIEVGDNPEPHPGLDFSDLSLLGYRVIVRIQYRWGERAGTLPIREKLDLFLERVRTLVRNTRGVFHWIIGNEPNIPIEWPGHIKLTPEYVAWVYNLCHEIIHAIPGHESDQVITAPIGPWNNQFGIGWIDYFERMLSSITTVDAIGLHAYTHGSDPALIRSEAMMNPPYQNCHYNFRCYRDFLAVVPGAWRDVPVYITETNQDQPWLDERNGWIQAAYEEINEWNHEPGNQQVLALVLYRWEFDKWHVKGKGNVVESFKAAQTFRYLAPVIHDPPVDPPADPELEVRLRKLEETTELMRVGLLAIHESLGKLAQRASAASAPFYELARNFQDAIKDLPSD